MKHHSHYRHYLFLLLLLAGLALPVSTSVHAQDETILAVLPSHADVDLGGSDTVTLEICVTDAVDLNAFDITLTYDPAVLQLESWAHGGMLNISWEPVIDDQPGSFRVAAVQLGQAAVSGDGELLLLTFNGVAVGTSGVVITEAVLADPAGEKTFPALLHGGIVVHYPRFTLSGAVTLQGQVDSGAIPITLGVGLNRGYGPYNVQTGDQGGQNLQVTGVVEDTYLLTTHQPRYLNIHADMAVFVTIDGDTDLPNLHLRGGNAYWADNVIDISDASVVGAWYGKTSDDLEPGQDLHADVNFDGVVNIADLALVAGNFDLNSEAAYANWQP